MKNPPRDDSSGRLAEYEEQFGFGKTDKFPIGLSIDAQQRLYAYAKKLERERDALREAIREAPCPRMYELHERGVCFDCRRYIQPCWKRAALEGQP